MVGLDPSIAGAAVASVLMLVGTVIPLPSRLRSPQAQGIMSDIDALRRIPVAGPEAHAPELSNSNSIRHLLQHAGHFLIAEMTIREVIDVFDRAEAEELAVVESNGTLRVVGLLNEAYALRRYAAASDLRRRELTGTI
jgi:hypothetical protein